MNEELCRTCGKNNYMFCDINHEAVKKLIKLVPSLIDSEDRSLPVNICINCFQMIKTIVFNIEGIADMQKILKIQNVALTPKIERKRFSVEDIAQKYSNIKLRRISVPTSIKKETTSTASSDKTLLVEEEPIPNQEQEKNKKEPQRSFMCISCSHKFNMFSQLEIHLKTCKTTKNQKFKCFCGKILISKDELSTHVTTNHKMNKRHICTICNKIVTSFNNLQDHMMTHKSAPAASKISNAQKLKTHKITYKTSES